MTGIVDDRRRARVADPAAFDIGAAIMAGRPDRVASAMVNAVARSVEQREAFRQRWCATGMTKPGSGGEEAMALRVRVLFERVGEAVQDVEDGRADLLATALGEALAEIDCLDEALTDLEVWVRQLALRQGVDFTAVRERRRAELGVRPVDGLGADHV